MAQPFNPDKIINYNIDYYAVLGLEQGCLPVGKTREERQDIAQTLLKAMRAKMYQAHPDHGGSAEEFRLVLQAERILSDPILRRIYESGGKDKPKFAEEGTGFEIDWEKLGSYRPDTLADTVGYDLFLKICERTQELGIVPAFHPTDETHSYEWDFALPNEGVKLSLSCVYDENDWKRLTNSDDIQNSLPFKIYFCIPRQALHFLRKKEETVFLGAEAVPYTLNGTLQAAAFSDYNLLETTKLEEALAYVAPGGKLETDLVSFRDGTLIAQQQCSDEQAKRLLCISTEAMTKFDTDVMRALMMSTMFLVTPDPKAADFLQTLPDSDTVQ